MPDSPITDSPVTDLQQSADEVLEKMFFIQTLGETEDRSPHPEFIAHLEFEGEPSGWLALCVTAPEARSVAADFLGEEEAALSDQQIREVIGELANMICGSLLSRKRDSTFRLSAPRLLSPGQTIEERFRIPDSSCSTTHAAGIGNGRLMVIFNTDTPTWSAQKKPAS